MKEEGLEKVHVDLPNHWAAGGEYLWATPLGDDLFRLENVPFYAYGLNFHDVVRATVDSDDGIPEIREVVQRSGHRTFRVGFRKQVDRTQQEEILSSLREWQISWERCNHFYFSLDLQPEGKYQQVFDKLDELFRADLLIFETCDTRVAGSFDDLPAEEIAE